MDFDLSLYLATDRHLLRGRDLNTVVAEAIRHGVTLVQWRDKTASTHEAYEAGTSLHEVTRHHGVPLIVNDRVDLMLAIGAEGVHLGPHDLPVATARRLAPGKIIGCSANSLTDIEFAERAGADYAGVGPVFPTATKPDHRPTLGVAGLHAIVAHASLPCVAIGGITAENAATVVQAGAVGVCVISAILGAEDIASAVRRLREEVEKGRTV